MSGAFQDFFTDLSTRKRLRWPAGEAHLHLHALPPSHLAETIADTYAGLADLHPDLALVPPAWIHMTVLHSLPTAQLTEHQLTEIEVRLTARLGACRPIEVVMGPGVCWGAFGVVSQIARTSDLDPLWEAARDVVAEVTGSDEYLPRRYAPHVSIAYSTGPVPVDAVRRWLGDRALPTLTWTIHAVHLLSQEHDNRTITWRDARRIPLGTADPAQDQPATRGRTD